MIEIYKSRLLVHYKNFSLSKSIVFFFYDVVFNGFKTLYKDFSIMKVYSSRC